jgi:predicted DNA-binding antitoxin AbrB/MazE fold protein
MSERIDAIFDHGVLRPLVPLALPDQARVKLTVDVLSDSELAEKSEGNHGALEDGESASEFDAKLDALLFDGPVLPPDFSRADIYLDHD